VKRQVFQDRVTITKGSITVTDEGYLIVPANFTRTGIFDYTASHGVKMLRPQDQVFNDDSMNTLVGKSVTVAHPSGEVTQKNWRDLEVGQVLDVAKSDKFLAGKIIVKDSKTIGFINSAIKNKDSIELSCGYDASIKDEAGKTDEGEYQAIQEDIRYNHVAIVTRGRAGKEVKLLIDHLTTMEKKMKVKLFDAYIEIDDGDVKIIEDANQKLADAQKAVVTAETDKALLETEKAKLADEVEQLKKDKLTDEQVEAVANEMAEVHTLCDSLKIDRKEKKVSELKKTLIDHFLPTLKITDMEDSYVSVAWDATLELARKASEKNDKKGRKIADGDKYVETAKLKKGE